MIDFFEFSNEMLCLANEQGYFTRVNPAWTKTLGWSPDELTSRPFVDFVHPDDLAATIQEANLLLTGKHETVWFENRYRCRDGSYRWLAWRAVLEPGTRQLVATARDITDQKLQAAALHEQEAEVRASQEKLLLALEASHMCTWELDLATRVMVWSKTVTALFGNDIEEMHTRFEDFLEKIHPDDRAGKLSSIAARIEKRGGEQHLHQFRYVQSDGIVRWIESKGHPYFDSADRPVRIVGVMMDITERKEAENALRESEERFRALATQAPVGIFQDDRTASCTFVNEHWNTMTGLSSEESLGYGWMKAIHPDDLPRVMANWEACVREQREYADEYRLVRKNGDVRSVITAARAIKDAQGNVVNFIGTLLDITERKEAENALRESEERFRLLSSRAPIGIAQASVDGSIFFANDKWCEFAGTTPQEALGFAWKDFIHPDDLPGVISHWQTYLQAGQDMPAVEFRFVHRNSELRWVSSSSAMLKDAAGKVVGQIASLEDITKRKAIELRFRGIYEQAPLGIALIDSLSGRFLHINPKYEEIIGRTESEMLSLTFQEITYRDDLAEDLDKMNLLLQGTISHFHLEKRLLRGDGTRIWVNLTVVPMWRPGETPVYHMAMVEDITERKVIENALRESEERFRALVTKAPVAVYQADESGRLLFINQRWYEMTGLTAEESSGIGWQRAIHPDDLDDLNEKWAAATAAHEEYANEFRIVHKDGSIRWLTTSAVALRDPQGRVVSHIGMSIDVTERKVIEEKLRLRESQLTGILDNTAAVVYLKDSEGRYLLANRHWQGLFRHLGNSVIGKTDREFFPAPFAEGFLEADAKVWREQAPIYFEETAPHADGPHTYRSVKFPVRDEMGKMIALGGISTDISDLKEAQEALRTKQQLLQNLIEVQEKEKQFLCHEFHDGLIQYAFGSAMLLESCRSNPQAADNASKLDTVIDNLRRGVEDGRRVIRGIRPAVLDDSGLEAAMEDLVGQYETSGIHVTSKCDPEIGRLPESIQTTVYRVVQEALNNAKKYSGTDVVRIELKKVNGDLLLKVHDFGCGFDVESARRKGFGLTGMTERVRLLGGECVIQSELDAGTRISVRVPLSTTEVKS